MTAKERHDLLQALCELLPESDASTILAMSPDDPITYVEAYTACTRAGVRIDRVLRRRILAALDAQMDEDDRKVRSGLN
jgi:hypothetical protein